MIDLGTLETSEVGLWGWTMAPKLSQQKSSSIVLLDHKKMHYSDVIKTVFNMSITTKGTAWHPLHTMDYNLYRAHLRHLNRRCWDANAQACKNPS